MPNEVSIIIRVNDTEAEKLRKTAQAATAANREMLASSAQTEAANRAQMLRERANAEALFRFKIQTLGETATAEAATAAKIDRIHAAALADDIARGRARIASEAAVLDKMERLHATAIAEDIAREKARTAVIARERAAVTATATRAGGAALGVAGIGAPAGLAIGAVLGTAFASNEARKLETMQNALKAVTGTMAEAQQQMGFVTRESDRLGTSIGVTAGAWVAFEAAAKGTNLEGGKARDVFLAVAEAGAKLGRSAEDTDGSLRALAQMISKGKVQAEELRGQLGDRLPGAFNIMARALGVSTAKLDDMLKKGEVISEEALPKFAAELRKTFGTDANTRIESTTANFSRLKNEISLTAAAIGEKLNPALSSSAGWMAEFLKDSRDYGFAAALAGSGVLDRQFEAEKAERLRGLDKVFTTDYTTGKSTFDFAPAALGPQLTGAMNGPAAKTGVDLLTSGQKARSEADLKELANLQKQIALIGMKTELEKAQWEIEKGQYRDADAYVKSMVLELARQKDAQTAQKAAAKDAAQDQKEADKDAEKALGLLMRKEELERKLTHEQMVRNEIDREQLAVGRSLTDSERQLVELRLEGVSVSGTSLEKETRIGAELERQILLRKQINTDADRAAAAIEGNGSSRQTKRDIRDAQSISEINGLESTAIDKAGDDHLERIAALEKERETNFQINRDYDALELESFEQMQNEKTRITREAEDARVQLMQTQSQVIGGIFGSLADAAQGMGKKGFKAYKAFAIAEATASMFSGAVGAFAQASKTFPPPYGQILGGVAAAAVVASGMAQIAQIKSLNYEGGRRFGGPVSAHSLYEVVENREPEVFKSKEGRVWMIPGADGNVHPAKAAAAAAAQSRGPGGNVEWTIVNNAPGITITPRGNTLTVDAIPALMDLFEARTSERLLTGKGPMSNAIGTKFGARGRQVR